MSTATPTAPARSARRAQAVNPPNGSATPAAGDRWFINDAATKRVCTTANPALAQQIAELEKSTLPASVKGAALAGLKSQQASEKPLTLVIARATKPGLRDLISVNGGFKQKNLSPTLVQALVDNAGFVQKYLAEFHASDE